jgi:pimeloyl-ACP methyl ester carboxylesterase
MFYSVVCAEDVPFAGPEAVENEVESYFTSALDPLREACAIWPQGDVPPDFHEPVSSDIPVLLLSGEADPVTPPQYAEQAAETLSNSMHLIAPGSSHITMGRGCTPELTAAFIDSSRLGTLQRGCLENLKPPPFFINFAGPPP